MNEYETLGRPGAGKTLVQVIQDVEDEMSKNLTFTLEKDKASGKVVALICGKTKVQLPPGTWKNQIYKESSGVPFVSTGKVSTRCIALFREKSLKDEAEKKAAAVEPLNVPLPGNSSAGATPSEPGQKSSLKSVYCFVTVL